MTLQANDERRRAIARVTLEIVIRKLEEALRLQRERDAAVAERRVQDRR